jgi:D-3-phosphoglycerate dehydrogenase / 2-oxoglutarate reductase
VTSNLILIALSTFAERDRAPLERLESSGLPFKIHRTGKRITTPELLESGRDAGAIVAGVEPYDARTLDGLPALRCISRVGVGVDAIDLAAARARRIAVLNTPEVPTAAVAELALAMSLALQRNLVAQSNSMRERRWERLETHLLGARTVGVIGLGRIGRRVAELSAAFGARVIGYDPIGSAQPAVGAIERVSLDALLATADVVSLHAAHSETHPLRLGAAEIARMKRGAVLVNLARGTMVDETALHQALVSGHLAGAGLDVFPNEPYAGPLCDLPNVILTPHSATTPVETRTAMELEAVDKAIAYLSGTLDPRDAVVWP